MAKKDPDLFDRLRQVGMRKQAAKALSGVSDNASKQAQRAARAAVSELRALADEIERRLPAATRAAGPSGEKPAAASRARTMAPRSTEASTAGSRRAATAKPRRAPSSTTPSETLDDAHERQNENLENVKKGIAHIVTAKKRLALQQQQLGEQGAKLDAEAREAMLAGREDVARAALERKQLAVHKAGSLDQQIAQLESEQGKLIEAQKQLSAKTQQFRSKKEVIEAKARAEAVYELLAAGSFEDLKALGSGPGDVDRQLDQLGIKSVVDDEFARLKAEVQSGTSQSALSAGDGGTADHAEAQQPAAGDGETVLPG